MSVQFSIDSLSPEQQELWQRVNDLWTLSLNRNAERIRATLHPQYVGWDMSSDSPHDRDMAVKSVTGDSPLVTQHHLQPLSIEVYNHTVGIVHYSYSANIIPKDSEPLAVTGKWTEIYLKQDGGWIMIGVSGRPDPRNSGSTTPD